jgi:hypothetical protein
VKTSQLGATNAFSVVPKKAIANLTWLSMAPKVEPDRRMVFEATPRSCFLVKIQ